LNKYLHGIGLLLDPTCAACGVEEESALPFIYMCSTLTNLKTQIFGKPILSVSEYEEMSAGIFVQFAENSGRFETHEAKFVQRFIIHPSTNSKIAMKIFQV
jgi:hypothetical protein